jgi:hypothetical protein
MASCSATGSSRSPWPSSPATCSTNRAAATACVKTQSGGLPQPDPIALRDILEGGLLRYLDQAHQVLTEPFHARGQHFERVDAAARAAIDLHTWRALAPLGDAEAAELAAGLIELAANT